jgi:tight adherence protein C
VFFVIIGLVLVGAAVTLLLRAISTSRMRATENLGAIQAYGYGGAQAPETSGGPLRGVVDEIADVVGGIMAGRFGKSREAELRRELVAGGLYSLSPRKFMGYQLISALSFPVTWTWFATTMSLGGALVVLGDIAAIGVGWWAPLVIVRRRARFRLQEIDDRLPELIDLLVVTVEAGLGFTGSLKLAAERLPGALGDELRLALQEQAFGLATSEVLVNMLGRTETPGMRSFVRSVVQGESLGVSIGQILRNLSSDMRKRRWAAAEERAQKAPVKMLFPLVFLIFPAMFVVLLGPAVYAFMEALGGA